MAESASNRDHHQDPYGGNVLQAQDRLFPVSGQNILIQPYPTLVSAGSNQIPYSTSNNDAFNQSYQHSNGGPTVTYEVDSGYVNTDFMSQGISASHQHQQIHHHQQQIQQQQQLNTQIDKQSMNNQLEERNHGNTTSVNADQTNDDSSDEDSHQCGRCKEVFHDITSYMKHKSTKVCKNLKTKQQQQQQTQSQPHVQIQGQPPQQVQVPTNNKPSNSPVVSVNNQNILEAAAKNTIFRDSFIAMDEQQDDTGLDKADTNENEDEDNAFYKDATDDLWGDKDKDGNDIIMKLTQDDVENAEVKKKRGRPPKVYGSEDLGGLDSPPKAKRKSRPPRRHKPHYDPRDEGNGAGSSNGGNSAQGGISNSLFDTGRSRGRGRGRHPSHRCPICFLLFPSRMTMIEHKRKHTKIHKCKICNEGFYTEDRLEKHSTKEAHSYSCDQCERSYVNKQALMRHKLSHSEKIFKCDQCSRAFKTQRDLKHHVEGMHSQSRDYVCEVCEKAFSRPEKLKRHLMIHAPDRPVYTCPFKNHVGCDKTFYRKDKLTRHLYSHSKVKPFKCDQCDRSFARTDNLREHIRSHTGVFRYYCTVCGKGQPGPKKFLQHMLKQHNVENAEIPRPFDDIAPEPLIQQHKAVVEAETAARLARAASNLKREREKKVRKESIETSEVPLDGTHMAITNLNQMTIQTVNPPNLIPSSPSQSVSTENQTLVAAASRGNIESLYTINHSSGSPQFQITRAQESMVRNVSEQLLREHLSRENLSRDVSSREAVATQTASDDSGETRLQEAINRQLNESVHGREVDIQQATITHTMVDADGNITTGSGRSLHLLSQGVLPAHLQFTTLLNSDLVAIGDAVIRPQTATGVPAMFQQKFGPTQ